MKVDSGSRTTGIAIVNDASGEVVFVAELSHRTGDMLRAKVSSCMKQGTYVGSVAVRATGSFDLTIPTQGTGHQPSLLYLTP